MDVNLENLIEKVKKEGVEEARQEADKIISEARSRKEEIIREAEKESEDIIKESKKKAEEFRVNSEKSVRQAARNVILSVREKLMEMFDSILKQEVDEALNSQVLADILSNLITRWNDKKEENLEVLVNEDEKDKVEKLVLSRVKDKAKRKFVIKSSFAINKGFQIGVEGSDTHYDFSDEGIIEALAVFLNPSLSSMISAQKDG